VPCIVDFKIRFKVGMKYNTVKYSTVIKYRSNILLKDTDKQINSFVMNFIAIHNIIHETFYKLYYGEYRY
jgi:hypothetical protein